MDYCPIRIREIPEIPQNCPTPPGYYAIDLDHVVSPDGIIDGRAVDLIKALDSYTERSPSRTSFHILIKADTTSAENIIVKAESGLMIEIKAPVHT